MGTGICLFLHWKVGFKAQGLGRHKWQTVTGNRILTTLEVGNGICSLRKQPKSRRRLFSQAMGSGKKTLELGNGIYNPLQNHHGDFAIVDLLYE